MARRAICLLASSFGKCPLTHWADVALCGFETLRPRTCRTSDACCHTLYRVELTRLASNAERAVRLPNCGLVSSNFARFAIRLRLRSAVGPPGAGRTTLACRLRRGTFHLVVCPRCALQALSARWGSCVWTPSASRALSARRFADGPDC